MNEEFFSMMEWRGKRFVVDANKMRAQIQVQRRPNKGGIKMENKVENLTNS